MKDLIDRGAVIDAFNTGLNELVVGGEENAKTVENYLNRVIEKIKCLPSAADVPDTNIGKMELINKQTAIDTILGQPPELHYPSWYAEQIRELPPVQLGKNLAEVGMDCISRAQAIDEFYKYPNVTWTTLDVMKKINALQPIQPKKGKWIGKYPVASVCSECGYLIHNGNVKAFAYCPNCGADMREVTE